MMVKDIPARYVGISLSEAQAMLDMTDNALEHNPGNEKLLEHRDILQTMIDRKVGGPARPQVLDSFIVQDSLGRNRQPAGQGGAHAATDKQIKFAKRLAAEKDCTGVVIPDFDHVGKKAVSAFIDKVIDRSAKVTETAPVYPASERQINWIKSMFAEKELTESLKIVAEQDLSTLTSKQASSLIDMLKPLPRSTVAPVAPVAPVVALEDGIYRREDGAIFKVYHTVHGRNVQVTKRLVLLDAPFETKIVQGKEVEVRAEFVYTGISGLRGLTPANRMTLEDGKKYGAVYGVCCNCGATLTAEVSIEAGIGPVCAKRFA